MSRRMTLNELCSDVWYIQNIVVKDKRDKVLANVKNYELQSVIYNSLKDRWVYSIGVIDKDLVVTVI